MTQISETTPRPMLDADAVRAAYRRWAKVYDAVFGGVSGPARRGAIAEVNRLPGTHVLEVGVGTGLALPKYSPTKRITGIDLSSDMLERARMRVVEEGLHNVEALLEIDAEDTGFDTGSFDIAVAMFVASVVPNPAAFMAEMRRVVRPGGHILLVNHFADEGGSLWFFERTLAKASHAIGWHPDFRYDSFLTDEEWRNARRVPQRPLKVFTLVTLKN